MSEKKDSLADQGAGDATLSPGRRRGSFATTGHTAATSLDLSEDLPEDPSRKSKDSDLDAAGASRPVASGSSPVAGPSREPPKSSSPTTESKTGPKLEGEGPRVELHQCGQCRDLPTFLSECLKVCTYLKVMGAEVKVVNYMLNFDGRYPRVKVRSGRIYENTNKILGELAGELTSPDREDLDHELTLNEKLQAYGLATLTEDYLGGEHREWYRTNRGELLKAYDIKLSKNWTNGTWPPLRGQLLKMAFKAGSSKKQSPKSEEPVRATDSCTILTNLSLMLEGKRFFFGDKIVSTLDVVVFAVLAPILRIADTVVYPLRDYITTYHDDLVEFVGRMQDRFYQDWSFLCAGDGKDNLDHVPVLLFDDTEKE